MPMLNPPHPGEGLKEDVLVPLGLTVTETAKALGISRKTLSEIVNGKSPITPDIAVRLERAFTNPPADMWLRLQAAYDLRRCEAALEEMSGAPSWKPAANAAGAWPRCSADVRLDQLLRLRAFGDLRECASPRRALPHDRRRTSARWCRRPPPPCSTMAAARRPRPISLPRPAAISRWLRPRPMCAPRSARATRAIRRFPCSRPKRRRRCRPDRSISSCCIRWRSI